jgi:hypothetical protein
MDLFKSWTNGTYKCVAEGTDVATLDCAKVVFLNILGALILLVGLVTLVMFIMGGYKIINAAGDPKKFQSGKSHFTYGLLGLSVTILAFTMLSIISLVAGVPCIMTFGFGC